MAWVKSSEHDIISREQEILSQAHDIISRANDIISHAQWNRKSKESFKRKTRVITKI